MSKKYDLKTIKEIVEVINPKNIDNFVVDFKAFLAMQVVIKEATKNLSDSITIKSLEDSQKNMVFTWIDDGKNDVTVKVHIKDKK